MRLRRHHDPETSTDTVTTTTAPPAAWELPATPAGAPVIRAPRAGDLAPATTPVAA